MPPYRIPKLPSNQQIVASNLLISNKERDMLKPRSSHTYDPSETQGELNNLLMQSYGNPYISPKNNDPRAAAHDVLNKLFGTPTREPVDFPNKRLKYNIPNRLDEGLFSRTVREPSVWTKNNPSTSSDPLVDDPRTELYLQKFKENHPKAYNRVGGYYIGAPQEEGTGGHIESNLWGYPIAELGPSEKNKDWVSPQELINHEMSHVMGLPDSSDKEGLSTAYDIGGITKHVLEQDIDLPKEQTDQELLYKYRNYLKRLTR